MRCARRRPHTILFVPLLGLVGCGAAPDWTGTVEPLPGGGERVRNPAEGVWRAGQGWTLRETLRIGRVEGDGPDVFGRIAGLESDAQGRIWVLDGQTAEVRLFDAGGVPVRTFGREGAGPGEFRAPAGLVLGPRGDLWIADPGNGRYARWDTAGTERETIAMRSPPQRSAFEGGIADGRLFDVAQAPGEAPVSPLMAMAGMSAGREVLQVMLRTDGGEPGPEAIAIPRLEEPLEVFRAGGMTMAVPYGARLRWRFDPRGYLWFGTTDAYRIVQRSFAGDTVRILERAYAPLPVTDADIDAWLATPSAARLAAAGGIDRSRIPPVKPVFEDLLVDDEGYLWVRLVSDDREVRFDVFDPAGRYLGVVESGERIALSPRPVFRDGTMLAVVRDALDVEYVVRVVVERGG